MAIDKYVRVRLADWALKERSVKLNDSFTKNTSKYILSLKRTGNVTAPKQKKIAAILVGRATANVRKSGRTVATYKDFKSAHSEVHRHLFKLTPTAPVAIRPPTPPPLGIRDVTPPPVEIIDPTPRPNKIDDGTLFKFYEKLPTSLRNLESRS